MRSLKQLDQNRRMNGQKKQAAPPEEEMEEEMELRPFAPINTGASVFDRGQDKRFGGINTAPSVFDRGAVFRTGGRD